MLGSSCERKLKKKKKSKENNPTGTKVKKVDEEVLQALEQRFPLQPVEKTMVI